ncbi:hypothetical protein OG738_32020 [Amycolatopsis sp. NBC_01488]|uniref:hypothetical protein n=1 Tax=Amycolatopsis sp. NBC_01488 TaxID=2903563 RepID=UPI002E2D2B59|nr:hypothetical protein [Amycolatopsis sp. NBC_01488]
MSKLKPLEISWQLWRSSRLVTVFLIATWAALQAFALMASTDIARQADACASPAPGQCSSPTAAESLSSNIDSANWILIGQMVVPVLVGVFWGAPLVAREYESHTYLFAWTQDVSPLRWTTQRLGVLAFFSICLAVVSGLSSSALAEGIHKATTKSMFTPSLFESAVGVQIAYYLLALFLGFAAGSYIRRVVPAIGAALFAFLVFRVALVIMRLKWLPASTQVTPFTVNGEYAKVSLPGDNSIQLDVHYANSTGTPVQFPNLECRDAPSAPEWEQCIRSHGVEKLVTSYQPGSHVLPVQIIEIAACSILAAFVALLAFRRVRQAVAVN